MLTKILLYPILAAGIVWILFILGGLVMEFREAMKDREGRE